MRSTCLPQAILTSKVVIQMKFYHPQITKKRLQLGKDLSAFKELYQLEIHFPPLYRSADLKHRLKKIYPFVMLIDVGDNGFSLTENEMQ